MIRRTLSAWMLFTIVQDIIRTETSCVSILVGITEGATTYEVREKQSGSLFILQVERIGYSIVDFVG